jgi:hypothetical protein
MDKEIWQFINSFAPWLSAIGTIAAVITALYIARRADRITLKIALGIRKTAGGDIGLKRGKEIVFLSITNRSRRDATITTLYWLPVPWSKKGIIWLAPQNSYSSAFPITLLDGETAKYLLSIEEFRKNFRDFSRELFSGIRGAIRLRLLRMNIYTSAGDVSKQRPEKPLRELFRTLAEEPCGGEDKKQEFS